MNIQGESIEAFWPETDLPLDPRIRRAVLILRREGIETFESCEGGPGHAFPEPTIECDDTQLSAWMNVSPKSSGYRIQLSAARMFGLIETTAGVHKLAPLGRMIVDPQREREARAKAFLTVPLYKGIYENYKAGVVPPPAALERDMVGLGVAEKQTGRARQVFERSAEQAGYFEHGKNRLVMPAVAVGRETPSENTDRENVGGGGDDGTGGLDPLLIALLKKIPPPDKGWPGPSRVRWFRTFAMNVSQIYDGDGEPVEMKIDLEPGSKQ